MTTTTDPRTTTTRSTTEEPESTMISTGQQAAPIPFHRLVSVEARKLFDTTTSKVLALAVVAMTVGLVVARGLVAGPDLALLFGTTTLAFATIMPVLGILSITGEWSHRTALTTFALEPRRARVMLAKTIPPLVSAVAATALALLVALPTTAVIAQVQDTPAVWNLELWPTLGRTLTHVLLVALGLGLGALLLNAPAAIVIALGSAVGWSFVALLGDVGATLREWLDLSSATAPLALGSVTDGDLARLATSVAFWIIIPLTAGVIRVIRKEVD